MKINNFLLITLILITATSALAELHDRGGGLIYDDVLDITWLQDANYAQTSGYDDYLYGYDTNGRMTWIDAIHWAENLIYFDPIRDKYWDNWRLMENSPVIPPDYDISHSWDGSTDKSYNIISKNCEMAYMYYVNLGNIGFYAPDGSGPQPGYGLINIYPFINLQNSDYWSGRVYNSEFHTNSPFYFDFKNGYQYLYNKNSQIYSWIVMDGDVGPAPISIDIMPRTCPNECPIKGGGSVEVAILGTVDFDVTDIDIASVRLEGIAPVRSSLKDKSSPVVPPPSECECTTEGRDG